jgi:aspartate-semialdehyde dehydrogenase
VSVLVDGTPSTEEVMEVLRSFSGRPQDLGLPTAPRPPIVLMDQPNRPQPRLDAELGGGMAVSIGRVRPCPVQSFKFVALGHNTIRGAAGASILNAELMKAEGLL